MKVSSESKNTYQFTARVMVYGNVEANTHPKKGAWYFAPLPKPLSASIKNMYKDKARGWGSLPVAAKIGLAEWETSIFPDTKSGVYLLPIKAGIRKKEMVGDGDTIKILITILPYYERGTARS